MTSKGRVGAISHYLSPSYGSSGLDTVRATLRVDAGDPVEPDHDESGNPESRCYRRLV